LGDRFVQSFYSSVHRVSTNAEIHRAVAGEFRRVLVEPFPYKLYFRIIGNDVIFVLLIHAARDPRLVQRLLRNRA
jgi:hypothetical protein